jgi:hypothetical protein
MLCLDSKPRQHKIHNLVLSTFVGEKPSDKAVVFDTKSLEFMKNKLQKEENLIKEAQNKPNDDITFNHKAKYK